MYSFSSLCLFCLYHLHAIRNTRYFQTHLYLAVMRWQPACQLNFRIKVGTFVWTPFEEYIVFLSRRRICSYYIDIVSRCRYLLVPVYCFLFFFLLCSIKLLAVPARGKSSSHCT